MKKKMTKDELLVACVPGLAIAMVGSIMAWVYYMNADDATSYIVTDKQNNKIVFQDMDSLHTERVMEFDANVYPNFYKYVNIGDTLRGKYMDKRTNMSAYNTQLRFNARVPKISKINGHSAATVIEMREHNARRDSVMHNVKTR